jgi:nicotinamidase-related amidase
VTTSTSEPAIVPRQTALMLMDFQPAIATDDHDPEVHRVLIEKVLPHQADVITTPDLKALVHDA